MSSPNFDCTVNAECLWNHLSCVLMDLFIHLYPILANPVSVLVGNTGDTWAKQRGAFLEDAHLTIPTIFASSLRNIQRVQAEALSSHQLVLTYSLAWDVCRNHGVRIEMPIWKGKETPAGSALSTIFEMLHMHCWQEAFKYPTLSMSPDARYIMPFTLTPSRHSWTRWQQKWEKAAATGWGTCQKPRPSGTHLLKHACCTWFLFSFGKVPPILQSGNARKFFSSALIVALPQQCTGVWCCGVQSRRIHPQ